MNISVYVTGLLMGLSLLMAIGAQNAFVLRQGLRNQHVFWVCLLCALSDAILVTFGVSSFSHVMGRLPWLDPVMRYGGALFLFYYGLKSLRSAVNAVSVLEVGEAELVSLPKTLLSCLALTWLNPHVYLDTVVLLGTISTHYAGQMLAFACGAISASFGFFFLLGYGATWLRPLFAKPLSWRVLDGGVAVVMWSIALKLISVV